MHRRVISFILCAYMPTCIALSQTLTTPHQQHFSWKTHITIGVTAGALLLTCLGLYHRAHRNYQLTAESLDNLMLKNFQLLEIITEGNEQVLDTPQARSALNSELENFIHTHYPDKEQSIWDNWQNKGKLVKILGADFEEFEKARLQINIAHMIYQVKTKSATLNAKLHRLTWYKKHSSQIRV